MHFLVHRDLRQNPLVRWLLVFYLALILAYLLFRPWLQADQLGLTPNSIHASLFGDPTSFQTAKAKIEVATYAHTQTFFQSLLALVLGATVMRFHLNEKFIARAVQALFVLPVLEALGAPLALYVSPLGVWWMALLFWLNLLVQLMVTLVALHQLTRKLA